MATRPRTRKIGRLSEIAQVAVRHGFGYFFERHKLTDLLPWTSRAEIDATVAAVGSERGRHLRDMLDELGPTFVKFGQLLSTRPDVVPPDIVVELRGLQDDVRPFPFEQIREVVEAELGLTLEQAFLRFDEQPIAAASIGQVHRATLPNGDEVVVKVQRPNAPAPDRVRPGAALPGREDDQGARPRARLHRRARARRRVRSFDPAGARLQARGAPRRQRSAATSPTRSVVVVPKVYWDYSSVRLLTLDFLDGVQLADLDLDDDFSGGAAGAGVPRHADVDGDDLRARLLPRRPASGERARPRRRAHRPRRLRARREADRRGHGAPDAPLHRRRDRERGRVAAPPRRARRPVSEGARGGVRERAPRALLPLLRRQRGARSTRSR